MPTAVSTLYCGIKPQSPIPSANPRIGKVLSRSNSYLIVRVFPILAVAGGTLFWLQSRAAPSNSSSEISIQSQTSPSHPPPSQPISNGRSATLEEALTIARQGLEHLQKNLIDYRGRLVKQELVDGTLTPRTEMEFKIRNRRAAVPNQTPAQSMAVYLRFLSPENVQGREVLWVEDENRGKLIAHEAGLLGLTNISLDPRGSLAMRGNRYPLPEIGFVNLIETLLTRSALIDSHGGADVIFHENYTVGDRSCLLIEVRPRATSSTSIPKNLPFDFSLAKIAIDSDRNIPLYYAAYGIPASPSTPPPLQEEYTYLDVQLNVGLTPLDFQTINPAYNFRK